MTFNSDIFIVPGYGNSGPAHWQSVWEQRFNFNRINQSDWEKPVKDEWIAAIDAALQQRDLSNIILVGHSMACSTIAFWAARYNRSIKGALLVAPCDTEADTCPPHTTGFTPIPTAKLPFKSITVTATDDYFVTPQRATYFAHCWGSKLVNIGQAGHINIESGYGEWDAGLALLKELDT